MVPVSWLLFKYLQEVDAKFFEKRILVRFFGQERVVYSCFNEEIRASSVGMVPVSKFPPTPLFARL